MYLHCAKAIWSDLYFRFSQTNIPKLFNLRKEISCLSHGNMSISAYFTKYRSLVDELDALSEFPRCTCGKCTCENNQKLENYMKSNRLAQFLMGLNDLYTVIRGHILMMMPPPTLSEAYGLLLQEENQIDKHSFHSPSNLESSAMAVKPYMDSSQNRGTRTVVKKPNDSLCCDFCQTTGHSREKCFCIHGYPEWHKMFGKPKPKPRTQKQSTFKPTGHVHNVADTSTTNQLQASYAEDHKGIKDGAGFSGSLTWGQLTILPPISPYYQMLSQHMPLCIFLMVSLQKSHTLGI